VNVNSSAVYGGTIDGFGTPAPSNFAITLRGNAVLRHTVRRIDAAEFPAVPAPVAPHGNRNVTLFFHQQSPGDFNTLRNLTLNGLGLQVAVPPGAYGDFTANGPNTFILGQPGATEPAIYHLRQLTLNAGARLSIAGPVILTVANSVTINAAGGVFAGPNWFVLNVASGGLTLNALVTFEGFVIAPAGHVAINGFSALSGGVIADRLTVGAGSLLKATPP
jgi:hypothetical protein